MYGGSAALTPRMLDRTLDDDPSSHAAEPLIQRQALHATTLSFRHPMLETPLNFQAPLPDDLAGTIRFLRIVDAGHRVVNPPPPGATVDLGTLVPSAGFPDRAG
jgi:hypothetical protein